MAGGVWVTVLAVTGRSSAASLIAATSLVGALVWLQPGALPVGIVLALGVGLSHVANIQRLVAGEEAAIVRPVRWGRAGTEKVDGPEDVLARPPAGFGVAPTLWRTTEARGATQG